jgi:hypothetical protein
MLGRCRHKVSTEPNSEDENVDPSDHCPKQRRIVGSSSAKEMQEMQEFMQKNEEHRSKFEGMVVKALEDSMKVYERTQEKFVNILMEKLN